MQHLFAALVIATAPWFNAIATRFKAACRTNEPQTTFVTVATMVNVVSLATSKEPQSLLTVIFVVAFWPLVAFIINLINPLPTPDSE